MKFILLLVVFSTSVFSQSFTLKGQVLDSLEKSPLQGATVLITSPSGGIPTGATTGKNGYFEITSLERRGNYTLTISFLGYNSYSYQFTVRGKELDLGRIYLVQTNIKLKDIEVVGELPPVQQKGDTTEYAADAFKTRPDANAEDLVAKMPGVTVQNGKVQAQGEEVKQVLVDGKPFFGDDPNAALKNLPAEMIDRIQIFDQQSEQSQFTGFDDGNTRKTLNIVTRNRVRNGTFGKFFSGIGNEDKYKVNANFNYFKDDTRFTLLALTNNINEQNFSFDDILGVMGSSPGPMRSLMSMGQRLGIVRVGGGGGGRGGNDASDFMVGQSKGLNKTHATGINYSDKWGETFELTGSYFFNYTQNNADSRILREYFLSGLSGQTYDETSASSSKNINHRLNFKIEYTIDSSTSILFRPRLTAQINDGSSFLYGLTNSLQTQLNSVRNNFRSDLSAIRSSNELLIRHKFETRGRTISLSINGGVNNSNGNNNLFSENFYFNSIINSDTTDQYANLDKTGNDASASLNYTEPITESSLLQLTTGFSYSDEDSDRETYTYPYYSASQAYLDTVLSNVYTKYYRSRYIGTGYVWRTEDLNITAGINYRMADLQNTQTFPLSGVINRSFVSWQPSFQLRWNISRDKNLRFNYRTDNNAPSVDQLQNVLDNSNPVQLSIGNPNLKQDYRHTLTTRFSIVDFSSMQYFFVVLGGTFTNDYIGNKKTIATTDSQYVDGILLRRGAQITKPVNLDGNFNLRSFITYGLPISFLKSNLNFNLSLTYSKIPTIINEQSGFSNSLNYNIGVALVSNIGKELDFSVLSINGFNKIKNSLQEDLNSDYFTQNTSARIYWQFWKSFFINADVAYQYYNGLSDEFNRSYTLASAAIGLKLFEKDRGEIRLTINDIFNENTSVQRSVTDSYYEDSRSSVLGQYFILSFMYNLSNFN